MLLEATPSVSQFTDLLRDLCMEIFCLAWPGLRRTSFRMLNAVSRAALIRGGFPLVRPSFRTLGAAGRSRGCLQIRAMSEEKAAKDAAASG